MRLRDTPRKKSEDGSSGKLDLVWMSVWGTDQFMLRVMSLRFCEFWWWRWWRRCLRGERGLLGWWLLSVVLQLVCDVHISWHFSPVFSPVVPAPSLAHTLCALTAQARLNLLNHSRVKASNEREQRISWGSGVKGRQEELLWRRMDAGS